MKTSEEQLTSVPFQLISQEKAKELNSRLIERALELDGTCTGEHGVGLGKREYLPKEHGEALEVMKTLKVALDPTGILNPGKIFL